jgi:hypothetical protein
MKNSKLLSTIIFCIALGMFIQNQLGANTSSMNEQKFEIVPSKTDINSAVNRFKSDATITRDQKVYGATFSKEEATTIINAAKDNVYVRIGMVNNKMTIYIGNDNDEYIKPAADGYCPNYCPFD